MAAPQEELRRLPAVESVLADPALGAPAEAPREVVAAAVRQAVAEARQALLSGSAGENTAEALRAAILARAREHLRDALGPHYRRAINATGIILHTGLGRAVLAPQALRQIAQELTGYSVLQSDVESGRRDQRDARIEWLLRRLTGAEAATVVNNNAAATALVLNTVAKGREVIVSRGQLVEIGGSFRLPDVMAASGAVLVEVGTTNRTHARDYEAAVSERTAAILRVHPSNYRITGFTSEVPLGDLVRIAHRRGVLLIDDVGAGSVVDVTRWGFAAEPTLLESVAAGADLITSSADKMIGGPQGGLILGKAPLVEAVRKNPFARIVRVDKLTLAALEATLTLFLDESTALRGVPTLRLLARDPADIAAQAERMADALHHTAPGATAEVIPGFSQVGSGSLPGQDLPTRLVAVRAPALGADELARRLRRHAPPIFARIQDDRVLLDPRTLLVGDEEIVIRALAALTDVRSAE